MRKSIKKFVSVFTAAAMAFVGVLATNPVVAKAGTTKTGTTKTIHVICNDDVSSYDGVALQVWGGLTTTDTVSMGSVSKVWGEGDNTQIKPLTLNEGKADVTVSYDGSASGMQFIKYTATKCDTANTGHETADVMAALNDAGTEIWMTFTGSSYTVSTTDPSLLSATEKAIAAIDAIGTVSLGSKDKIEAAEAAYAALTADEKTNVTNYATLTAARTQYDALKKAQDDANAAAAGELTVYVKAPAEWTEVAMWAWTSAGNLFEAWPGQTMAACDNNDGYFKATIKVDGVTSIIFAGGKGDIGQTDNIEELAAGTYWFTLTPYEEGHDPADINGRPGFTVASSTTAPEGWAEEEKAEIETQAPTKAPEEGEEDTTEDVGAAWDSMKLKIHFLNSEEWEKVGVYLTYGSWAEITGAWPGAEMGLEVGSETWYAVGTNGTAEETYNVIFNNLVSDAEADEGAVKHQTADTKELTTGEYWFVLDEVTAESDTQVTYSVKMYTSVEDLEKDGYTYDGQGLDSVEDPAGEEAEDTTEAETEAETEDDKADGAETGDVAPVAVMVLGLAAVVAVVAAKKKQNA